MKNCYRAFRIFSASVIFLIAGNAGAQSVKIDAVSGSSFCLGGSISVTFTATGFADQGNTFILQLSDTSGSFLNGFQNIGSLVDTSQGILTINSSALWELSQSVHYRLRILATNPATTSPDNGSNIAIWPGPGDYSLYTGVPSGSVGMPLTFYAANEDLDPFGKFQDSAFWDFGSGAMPENATTTHINTGSSASFSKEATFSTTGNKTISVTIVNPGGCSETLTHEVHIYDCGTPSIPQDAIVCNSGTTQGQSRMTYWINPGATLYLSEQDTVFAESGSTINGSVSSTLYMKGGSVFTAGHGDNNVIYGDGASINTSSSDFTLNCPTLDFDYSNAPPNPAHPSSSVKSDLTAVPITLSPNPTSGILTVQGLPSDRITVSVFNTLGETVMAQRNPIAPDFTLDLSKLDPGTYYIRFSLPNSVVTKKIIRK